MSIRELLPSPATAPAASPGDGSVEGRALSAAFDTSAGFTASDAELAALWLEATLAQVHPFDLSAHLYGGKP